MKYIHTLLRILLKVLVWMPLVHQLANPPHIFHHNNKQICSTSKRLKLNSHKFAFIKIVNGMAKSMDYNVNSETSNWTTTQGIIYLVSHHNLLCIFFMTAIQDIFCIAVFLHRSVQNLAWNICLLTEFANQIWRGKLFPATFAFC